jgi:hypothetical protein
VRLTEPSGGSLGVTARVGVTDLVYLDSFTPLGGDSYRLMLSGNAVIKQRPSGSAANALTGRTPLLAALLGRYGTDPNVPSRTFGVAFPPGLFAPAMRGDRDE